MSHSKEALMKNGDDKKKKIDSYTEPETLIVAFEKEKKIYVVNEIDDEALPHFVSAIDITLKQSIKNKTVPLQVYIQSPGGTIATALSMYDELRELDKRVPVWTIVQGNASSAALLLSQAGRKRLIFPHAFIQFHSAHIESLESYQRDGFMQNVEDIERNADVFVRLKEELKTLNDILFQIIHERTGISFVDIKQFSMESKTMTAKEAITYGLFDGIVGEKLRNFSKK